MDSAVALVQAYLRVNGYFTVSEYPVVEFATQFQAATDLDILAVRFPHSRREISRETRAGQRRHGAFSVDSVLEVPEGKTDMIVGEVKEGAAEFNRSGRRPDVLAVALARFGCCEAEDASTLAKRLVRSGSAETPTGHSIRLVAFGSKVAGESKPYQSISLGHVVRFLKSWVDDHWEVLRHTQSKDPVISFLLALAKADRGGSR